MNDRAESDRVAALAAAALEHANDAIVVCDSPPRGDPYFTIRYVNASFEHQTGYTREEVLGRGVDVLYGPETDRSVVAELAAALMAERAVVADLRKYRKGGTPFWAEVSIRPMPIPSADGGTTAIIVQRDVTERIEAEAELELLSTALDYANDGIAVFRWEKELQAWCFRHVNEMFCSLTGYGIADLIGNTSQMLLGEATDTALLQTFRDALATGEPVRGEFAFYRKDGSLFWTELNGRGLRDEGGSVANTIIVYRDITEKRRRNEQLSFEAEHDPLTGLFNRRAFIRTLEARLAGRERVGHDAVLFFDLDEFKPINDNFGHEAGDRMLIELTSAVNARLRRGDVFARLGGDEFAILLCECPPDQCEALAEQVLKIVREFTLLWKGNTLGVSASIGAVCIDASDHNAADVMRRADAACYASKRAGRDRVSSAGY